MAGIDSYVLNRLLELTLSIIDWYIAEINGKPSTDILHHEFYLTQRLVKPRTDEWMEKYAVIRKGMSIPRCIYPHIYIHYKRAF